MRAKLRPTASLLTGLFAAAVSLAQTATPPAQPVARTTPQVPLQIRSILWHGLDDGQGERVVEELHLRIAMPVTEQELTALPQRLAQTFPSIAVAIEKDSFHRSIGLTFSPAPATPDTPADVANAQAAPLRLDFSELSDSWLHRVAPVYNAVARTARQQGRVTVELLISPDGAVAQTTVISGPPLLRRDVLEAMRQWTFAPQLLDDKPVSVLTVASVDFMLQ